MWLLSLYLIAVIVTYVLFSSRDDRSTAVVYAIFLPLLFPFVILYALIVVPYGWIVKQLEH